MGCGALIVFLAVVFVLGKLDAPWWGYAILVGGVLVLDSWPDKKKVPAPQPAPEPEPEDDSDAEERRQLAEMSALKRALDRRGQQQDAREVKLIRWEAELNRKFALVQQLEQARQGKDASELKPGSLKLIRNVLMKLHEARRTDVDYQQSRTSKEATAVLQSLNSLIEK